ncbi:putative cyclic nucleotide-binding domain, rmlC-like jelly roll [Helianthus anomalus]
MITVCRKVRDSERYHWAATQGVNEKVLMENFPEDLQRDICRHLFKFVKKVRIFASMDEPILDAICERLRQKTYIKEGTTSYEGGFVTKMVFIVRGKMESTGEDENVVTLYEGGVCGEELLTWCLEPSSLNGESPPSNGNKVPAINSFCSGCELNVIMRLTMFRHESPYWRGLAATTIQVAWRYRKKLLDFISCIR